MTALRLQLALLSSGLLGAAAAANMLFFQAPAGSRGRTPVAAQAPATLAVPAPPPVVDAAAARRRDDVRAIQRELEQRDYACGNVDGVLDVATRAAIMAYEFDQGLPLSGEPTDQLLRTLVLGPVAADAPLSSASPVRLGPAAREVIVSLQRAFRSAGYGGVETDGTLGPATVAAIRRFERENRMVETGRVSGQLMLRLASLKRP